MAQLFESSISFWTSSLAPAKPGTNNASASTKLFVFIPLSLELGLVGYGIDRKLRCSPERLTLCAPGAWQATGKKSEGGKSIFRRQCVRDPPKRIAMGRDFPGYG